ncbi:MAG TPA: hypothetical protein VLQ47_03825 [Rhodoferax sp.]|nr:hypothetical protein [Rhodoferax sp.]
MQKVRWRVFFLVAGMALAWQVYAQTIYRCGNTYSHDPCPGAVPMDLSDARLPEQKKQTDAAALNDARLANIMEQERLAEEQRLLAAHQTLRQSTASAPAEERAKASSTRKAKRSKPKAKKNRAPPA